MELNNELRKMRRKAREAKNKNAEAKRTAGCLLLFIATAMLIVAVVGCAEKDKSEVAAKEEPELPEMSAHAGDEVDIDEPIEYSATEDTFEITAGAAADEYPNLNTDVTEADAADVPEGVELVDTVSLEENPNELFKVSQEWAAEQEGLYAKIDDDFYSLINRLPFEVVDKYDVGYVFKSDGDTEINSEVVYPYLRDIIELKSSIPSAARNTMITAGDFSPLQIHRDDILAVFGDSYGESVVLQKLDFVGYTIPAPQLDQSDNYYPVVNHVLPNNIIENNSGVYTLEEEPVDDVRNLEYGKKYLYECYIGTEYREMEMTATSRCYSVDRKSKVKLEITPAKNGYFVIELSNIEPGFYTCGLETVFEIVD